MIHRNTRSAAALAVALLAISSIVAVRGTAGDDATRAAIALAPGSTLWMEGKSTVHDWESKTSKVQVVFTRDPGQADPTDAAGIEALVRAGGVRGVDVDVPVATLRSPKSGIDKNMMKALKADQFPTIRFHMDRYVVNGPASGDTLNLSADGDLTVCSTTKRITLEARAWKDAQGVWIAGSEPLNMSDYGVKPPTMMMGTIKTNDRVVIHYRLLLAPAAAPAGSASQIVK